MSDPSDRQVQYALRHIENGGTLAYLTRMTVPESTKCYICKVYRQPLTEHCRICNTCVKQFDHHCKWLNNCVGSNNYRLFSASLTLTTLHVFVHTIVAMIALFTYALFFFSVEGEIDVLRITLQSTAFLLSSIFLVLLLKLWIFHIELIREDKTTYEVSMGLRSAPQVDSQNCHGSSPS